MNTHENKPFLLAFAVVCGAAACGTDVALTGESGRGLTPGALIEMGDHQSAYLAQELAPVMLRAFDGAGVPAAGQTVSVRSPTGATGSPDSMTTDAQGRVTLRLRVGIVAGTYDFSIDVGNHPSAIVHATAIAPPPGTLFTLANVDRVWGDSGVPGPSTGVRLKHPVGLALDADGTLYFSDQGTCRVLALAPSGVVSSIAGNGTCAAGPTSAGVATQMTLGSPTGLALDRSGRRLFIAETGAIDSGEPSYVRVVHLATGMMALYAGGGPGNGPYRPFPGDPTTTFDSCRFLTSGCINWPVAISSPTSPTNVELGQPTDLTIGPDESLYVSNIENGYILRISPDGSQAFWWNGQGHPAAIAPGAAFAGFGGADSQTYHSYDSSFDGVRFDSTGTPFESGSWSSDSGFRTRSIFRGAPGRATFVQHQVGVGSSGAMAFGPQDVLYYAPHAGHHIARVTPRGPELVTGNATLESASSSFLAATPGFTGDHVRAETALINSPGQLVITPEGHVVFADSGNATIRMIW